MATIVESTSTSGGPLKLASPVTVTTQLPLDWSLADLHRRLGGIPLERIRLYPPPGLATIDDVTRVQDAENRLCELIDGVLVEKTMGAIESELAFCLGFFIKSFAKLHDLGIVLGADGFLRLTGQQVRAPDVSFFGWIKLPGRVRPRDPIPQLTPDLAIDVLSVSNTQREMDRKLKDFFDAGVRLVWYIDPSNRNATVYTSLANAQVLTEADFLDGADVLPGFKLLLRDLFAEVGM